MGLLNKLWKQWHQNQEGAADIPVITDEEFNYAPHFIAGERRIVESGETIDVINPRKGRPERRVYVATAAAIGQAIQSAQEAKMVWGNSPYLQRLAVMEQFKNSFAMKQQVLNEILQQESGMSAADMADEIEQTLEAIVYALTALQAKGSSTPAWGNIEVWVQHAMLPIGVVAIVLDEQQTLKSLVSEVVVALLCGNAVIVTPHPCQPLLSVLLGDWLAQSGLPDGAYNVLQGGDDVVKSLHTHADIKAISYVLAKPKVKATHLRQRQTILAHNFIVVDESMNLDKVWAQFLAGHSSRLSVPIWLVVGQNTPQLIQKWQHQLAQQQAMVLPTADVKQNCSQFLQDAVLAGAELVVDGSQMDLPEQGWYMGMSLVDGITPEMQLHTKAPSRSCVMVMSVPDLEAAIDVINRTEDVGAANLFTESMSSMGHFKQALDQAEVISFNRVETVASLNVPRGDISHQWAVGGQHAARWQFYTRHQLIMGMAI